MTFKCARCKSPMLQTQWGLICPCGRRLEVATIEVEAEPIP